MHSRKPHGHLLISLNARMYPKVLILNKVQIATPQRAQHKIEYNLTVCLSKTVNYYAVKRLIQTIESYRYYGVDYFVIYKTNVSSEVDKVLRYYEKKKLLEIITWNIQLEYNLKRDYYGQIFKLNDCLYRNMYKTKALILTDWDEIIIPIKYNNIMDMINKEYKNKYNWYAFRSFLFHTEVYNGSFYDLNIPDTDIYQYREYCIFKLGHAVKNIYTSLDAINEVEVHFVYDGTKELKRTDVTIDNAYIRHTRRVKEFYYKDQCQTKWMNYPKNKREEDINIRVEKILHLLKLNVPIFKIHPFYQKLSKK